MKNKKQGNNWTAYYDPDTKRYTKNRSIWSICLGKAQLCIMIRKTYKDIPFRIL